MSNCKRGDDGYKRDQLILLIYGACSPTSIAYGWVVCVAKAHV